jgi:hypothetical protein
MDGSFRRWIKGGYEIMRDDDGGGDGVIEFDGWCGDM